MNVNNFYLA